MVAQNTDNSGTQTPFAHAALLYRAAGWPGVLPLPKGQKNPPPTGYTGIKAPYPTPARVEQWCEQQPEGNICLRLGGVDKRYEVIAVDVDHYIKGGKAKRGGDQLAKLIKTYGPLPDTWVSSSRVDGFSGKRFYRVPTGLRFKGQIDKDIECIQKRHRFAVVWPSFNPDSRAVETWFPPGAPLTEAGKSLWDGTVPDALTLPVLPDGWIDCLTNGRVRESDDPMDMDSSKEQIYQWAYDTLGLDQAVCLRMQAKVDKHLGLIRDEATSHDKIRNAHMNIMWLAQEGHSGWDSAVAAVEAQFVATCAERDKRDRGELNGEIYRSRTNGLRKVKGRCDERVAAGAAATDPPCDCGASESFTMPTTFQSESDTDTLNSDAVPAILRLADVAPTATRWLWKGWLPLGKVSIFEGESDVGKSTVTLSWASVVSNGKRWPDTVIDGETLVSQHDPGGVLLVGIEDSNSDTVVPRLIAAGADLSRVFALARPVDVHGKPKPFTIPDDINWLSRAVREANAKLVIIDPITACLPENTKHGVDSSVRRILMHLVDLAEEADCAIVLIRHFNKASGMNAKNRGGGSVAYSAVVRSVLQAAPLDKPTDEGAKFAIARAIGNLSPRPESITYALVDASNKSGLPKPEHKALGVAAVKYCGITGLTADQLIGADGANINDARKNAPMRDDAEEAIKEVLKSGPMRMTEAEGEAVRLAGCSKSTVKQAAKRMGIMKGKVLKSDGKIDYWTWELPPAITKLSVITGGKSTPPQTSG